MKRLRLISIAWTNRYVKKQAACSSACATSANREYHVNRTKCNVRLRCHDAWGAVVCLPDDVNGIPRFPIPLDAQLNVFP